MRRTSTSPEAPADPGLGAALDDANGRLALLAEMIQGFARSGDFAAVVRSGLSRITQSMGAEASSLFLLEGDPLAPDIVCSACSGPVDVTDLRLPWGVGIVGHSIARNEPLMVRDVSSDPAFAGAEVDAATGFVTRSILVAPLSVGDERIGAIEIINKLAGDHLFTGRDQALLETLCHAAALAISNIRLTERLVEQERMNRELELAAAIQQDLLPPPARPEYPVHGLMRPMYRVSGDFYDVLERPDGKLWFCVADVSGKGMNAALLMARTSSLFRCLAKQASGPGALLSAINAELCENVSHGMFVTLACGLYDPVSGRLRLASAGHEPGLLHDPITGEMRALEAGGPPLGIAPGLIDMAAELTLILSPEQSLYVFTDGLTEAADAEGRMLEAEGVASLIAHCAEQPVHLRPRALLDGVMNEGRSQRDDLTVLVLSGPAVGACSRGRSTLRSEQVIAELIVPGRAGSLRLIRGLLREAAMAHGADPDWTHDLVLAVDEACQNVIRHGYHGKMVSGDIHVQVSSDSAGLVIRVSDNAAGVGPEGPTPLPLDPSRPGGLGLHLMRSLTNECQWETPRAGRRNTLRLRKVFKPTGPEATDSETRTDAENSSSGENRK